MKKSELKIMIKEEIQLLKEGYTLYWGKSAEPFTDDEWKKLLVQVKKILAIAKKKGIIIRDGNGKGKPIIDNEKIVLNGDGEGEEDLSHETFYFTKKQDEWEFTKTNRKPYDAVVSSILYVAQKINPSIGARGDDGKSSIKMGGTEGWDNQYY